RGRGEDGSVDGVEVGRGGGGGGIAVEFRRDARDCQPALGSVAARSVDAGRGGGRGGAGRFGGVLFPGAAGHEGGSNDRSSLRITPSSQIKNVGQKNGSSYFSFLPFSVL